MGTGFFPGVKRPGRGADHPPLLAPRSSTSRAIPLLPSGPSVACYKVTFTFIVKDERGHLVTDCHSILGPVKESFLSVHRVNSVRQTETRKAEALMPAPIASEVEMVNES
jgi:hypothetical protein